MTNATPVISAEGLSKRYPGDRGILGLDLAVDQGEVFGFLGPNGAGKTTTIRLLLDLIRPTEGRARVLGLDARRDSLAIRRRVGYLPGELSLYPRLTGEETLRYFANLRGGVDWAFATRLCERLECDLTRRNGELSSGNRRKLGLVQALMHRPEVIILDEPTSGLDPLVQHEFYLLVAEARAAGQTIFLSSHILPEVQRTCDRVAFIRDARLIAVERVTDIVTRALREVEAVVVGDVSLTGFASLSGPSSVETEATVLADGRAGTRVHLTVPGSPDMLVKFLAGYEVVDLTIREPDLEDVFLTYYSEDGHAG
ncbi:MAG: ABC transporter ATP-binding protein [Thermoleophilia bacterium]